MRVHPIEIRILNAADASAYWHLRLEALETEPDAFSASPEEHRTTSVTETAARLASDPANNFIVGAFVERQLIGMAGFYRSKGPKECHKGHVWGVYVTDAMRRTGIARKLMIVLLERAACLEGVEQIVLAVATDQAAAIALYQSLGFRSFGSERRALKIGERYVDQVYMMLHLNSAGD